MCAQVNTLELLCTSMPASRTRQSMTSAAQLFFSSFFFLHPSAADVKIFKLRGTEAGTYYVTRYMLSFFSFGLTRLSTETKSETESETQSDERVGDRANGRTGERKEGRKEGQ